MDTPFFPTGWSAWTLDPNTNKYFSVRFVAYGQPEYSWCSSAPAQSYPSSTPDSINPGDSHSSPIYGDTSANPTIAFSPTYGLGRSGYQQNAEAYDTNSQYVTQQRPLTYHSTAPATPNGVAQNGTWPVSSYGANQQPSSQSSQHYPAQYASPDPREITNQAGYFGTSAVSNVQGSKETLDSSFRRVRNRDQKEFFRPGKVFKTAWVEPAGNVRSVDIGTDIVRFGERAYSEIRRFIVMEYSKESSVCIPIVSYKFKGTTKPGVDANEHALIYVGKDSTSEPDPLEGEELNKSAIRMESTDRNVSLHAASRINFGKLYTVEHTAKVVELGKITRTHMPRLVTYFREVRENRANAFNSDSEED